MIINNYVFYISGTYHKQSLTNSVIKQKRNEIFNKEKKRQYALITNIEKIQVTYSGDFPHSKATLLMNKDISTPYDCSKRKWFKSKTSLYCLLCR